MFVGVGVGVLVGAFVGVLVGVLVGGLVGVLVGVGVHAIIVTLWPAPPPTVDPLEVPDAVTKSVKEPTVQSVVVSSRLPVQWSPGLPAGASVVAGTPFTKHGTAPVEPPVQVGGSGQGTVFVTERPVT